MVDPGHYLEDEKETFCWFCKRFATGYTVFNNGSYTVVCKHCKSRGPKGESKKAAWKLWDGNGER
jgi:hypothetical protein